MNFQLVLLTCFMASPALGQAGEPSIPNTVAVSESEALPMTLTFANAFAAAFIKQDDTALHTMTDTNAVFRVVRKTVTYGNPSKMEQDSASGDLSFQQFRKFYKRIIANAGPIKGYHCNKTSSQNAFCYLWSVHSGQGVELEIGQSATTNRASTLLITEMSYFRTE